MKSLVLFLLFLTNTQIAMAGLSCQSVGVASCTTSDGYCIEFVENGSSSSDIWEQICSSSNGEYSEQVCGDSYKAATCINENNIFMPIIRFNSEIDSEVSSQMCLGLGGKICK